MISSNALEVTNRHDMSIVYEAFCLKFRDYSSDFHALRRILGGILLTVRLGGLSWSSHAGIIN